MCVQVMANDKIPSTDITQILQTSQNLRYHYHIEYI